MRGQPSNCSVHTVHSLEEALAFRAEHPQWRPLAGGTDLMVPFAAGRLPDRQFLNLWGLPELQRLEVTAAALVMGALCTFRQVALHPVVQAEFPNLVRSARVTGALAIQNRGTLGGNIANASPAADTPPSLLAYGAEVELRSVRGSRWVPYADYHTGYKRSLLAPDELLTRILVPRPLVDGYHYFRKVGARKAQAISKVVLAAWATSKAGCIGEIRIALGSVAPTPVRALLVESALRNAPLADLPLVAAREALARDIAPIDDIRSTARYRAAVAGNLLEEMLRGLSRSA
jgi:CO/xanthine dehydrogenase FAD-binding subunit